MSRERFCAKSVETRASYMALFAYAGSRKDASGHAAIHDSMFGFYLLDPVLVWYLYPAYRVFVTVMKSATGSLIYPVEVNSYLL